MTGHKEDCIGGPYDNITTFVDDRIVINCTLCGSILEVVKIDHTTRAETTPADALREAAKLYDERQATYGNNHDRLAAAMMGMFPEGVTLTSPQDHKRFAIIVLMVVKLTRYAVNWDRGGHSDSLKDLSVYAAMLGKIDEAGKC